MPVDYDAIREENIQRYGWDTAVLDLLGHLYSERTHFIFEIVQNAEDARANELTFELLADRLEVRHDGRPFTEADVRGICGVGKSTKSDDLTQIGKFGIGFKSVYAYTRCPSVHSQGEHFRIEKYVRPHAIEPAELRPGETLFVFPFDHDDVEPATAVAEISSALNTLDLGTLLFLRNIERLRICGVDTDDAVFDRVATARTNTSRHVALTEVSDGNSKDEEWYVWERPLDARGEPAQRVEIAFPVSDDESETGIKGLDESPLVVFFPTQKETFLGFLIHGPYRTTPARDNIPQHDAWNQALVSETAELLHDVLLELRDDDLLTVDVLQAMPIASPHFQPDTMFRPLFDVVWRAFDEEAVIPLGLGGFGEAAKVKLARGAGLRDLLSAAQLSQLYSAASR